MYSSTLSLTSALGGDGWATPHLAAVPLGQTRHHLNRRLSGHPGLVWMGVENLTPTGIQSPDCPSHSKLLYQLFYKKVLIKTQKCKFNF